MTAISIRRHELREYQAAELYPRLAGWTDLGDNGLMRRQGYVVQRLSLYRFSNWRGFRVHYSVQLTVIPDEFFHVTIGGTLHHWSPRWPKLPWVGRQWRELWVRWEDRSDWSARIIALAHEQAEPPISEPLTLEAVTTVVAREHAAAPDNDYIAWTAAMLRALHGHREQAKTDLVNLLARVSAWIEKAIRETPERVGERDYKTVRRLGAVIEALSSAAAFERYCDVTSRETEAAIGIASMSPP